MFRSSPSRTLILVSAGTTLLSTAFVFSLHGQPVGKAVPPLADQALQVANDLDAVAQARFENTNATSFGVPRLVTVRGHTNLAGFYQPDAQEQKRIAQANSANRDYLVAFLHFSHVPGVQPGSQNANSYRGVSTEARFSTLFANPNTLGQMGDEVFLSDSGLALRIVYLLPQSVVQKTIQKVVSQNLPHVENGQNEQASEGNWLVVMRPVRALQDSCLGCHAGAKRGDTLGVMVYAVSKKPDAGG